MLETTQQRDGVTVVAVQAKKLDAANVRSFKQELKELEVSSRTLVIDLTAVEFMDSAGLGPEAPTGTASWARGPN